MRCWEVDHCGNSVIGTSSYCVESEALTYSRLTCLNNEDGWTPAMIWRLFISCFEDGGNAKDLVIRQWFLEYYELEMELVMQRHRDSVDDWLSSPHLTSENGIGDLMIKGWYGDRGDEMIYFHFLRVIKALSRSIFLGYNMGGLFFLVSAFVSLILY